MSPFPDVYDDIDVVLPTPEYDAAEVYAEVRAINGRLLQQRMRFEQMTDRQIQGMAAIDSRFGGVDERLDKLSQQLGALEAQLARLVKVLAARD